MSAAAAAVQPFVCGGLAACFASCCIHPIDLAKVGVTHPHPNGKSVSNEGWACSTRSLAMYSTVRADGRVKQFVSVTAGEAFCCG